MKKLLEFKQLISAIVSLVILSASFVIWAQSSITKQVDTLENRIEKNYPTNASMARVEERLEQQRKQLEEINRKIDRLLEQQRK
jgi:hypothetical protein